MKKEETGGTTNGVKTERPVMFAALCHEPPFKLTLRACQIYCCILQKKIPKISEQV